MSSLYEFEMRMGLRGKNDVFQYEEVSERFRKQFILIVENCLADIKSDNIKVSNFINQFWNDIEVDLMLEFGELNFYGNIFEDYILGSSHSYVLYVIEKTLQKLSELKGEFESIITQCFCDINSRFLENSIGYEYQSNQLIRVDNKFIHREVITNAIQLLHEVEFESASREYMQAFTDYKNGNLKSSIINAGKAFESTMKIICKEMNYSYKQGDNAKRLISTLMDKGFIPSYLQTQFSGLNNTLKDGLPTVRNKYSHGDGAIEVEVTDKIVRYALNLCATNIVLLVEIYNEHISSR